jgi:outer membrane protein assembly factor BamB
VEPGLCEAIFEIEHARPGSGIFLADAQLRPSHRVGFFRDHRSGQTVLGYAGPGERRDAADYDENRQAVPLAGERTWLKLIAGVGKFECQVSGDGRHWGRLPEAPLRNMPPGFAAVGLYCLPGSKERAITLRRIELRELSALTGLAPAGVRQRAPPLHDIPEIGAWLQAVAESQPEDVAPAVWRRACAVRTLSGAPPIPLANALLHGLVREGLRLPLEPPQHLALLDEAALLADTWDQRESLRFEQYYAELAQVLRGRGKDSVWPMLETAFIESPLWSQDGQLALPESILRQEMLEAVYAQEWDRIAAMYRRLKHWDTTVEPERRPRWRREVQVVRELSDWGAAQAARELPRDVDRSRLPITAEGRHPLVEQVSKEGFSVLAELEATLRTGSYADAGQILSSIDPRQSAGLLPDSRDTRLLMGLREAIALAAMEHPAWQQMLREQFAPLGRLRVRQAIADGDADRVQAAALQFFGTDAAAEAERWLGERALLRGEFLAAVSHFEKALVDAPATWAADASARLRLAGAMLGQDRGASPVSPFELGGTHISPEEFERLVAELRAAHGGELGSLAQTDKAAVPAPTRFEVRRLGEFAHDAIADAGGGPRTFDWLGRRMGTATAGDLLIVSDGANLATYDLVSGQRRWLLPAVGGISLQRWASTAARPVVAGDKVFARRLSGSGPEVVCVSLQRGNVLWTWTSSGGPCSDALVVQGKVYVLTVSSQPDRLVQVGLQVLSASDGSAQGDFPLFQLRDYFNGYLPLLAALVGERIVAVGGGCVFACDLQGKLLWLRRQEWIPPALDTNGELQHAATLVPHGQQLIVTQAGARAAECLDSASGRLVWRYVEAELGGVRGCCQGVVLVETDRGWVGLDAKTGAVRWRRPVIALCEGVLCGTPGGFAYARRELIDGQAWRPVIEWMDPQTGQRRGRAPLPALRSSWAQLGPLVAHPRGLWAFHLREYGERNRALVALAPQGDPLEAGDSDRELLNWLTDPVREMHGEVAAVLPGWTLVAAGTDQRTGLFSQLANETDVLVTQATFLDRARLLRRLELPAGARAKLSIRVGHNGQSPWNLEVRAGGRLLLLEEVSPKTAPDGWLTRELDLAALSGTGAWLAVTHRSTSDQTSYAHWKKLEVRAAE